MTRRILITGGAGFIGSAVARRAIAATPHDVLVFDKLTYAGTLTSLEPVAGDPRFRFVRGDICDAAAVRQVLASFRPDIVMHLAAESHVDRSIDAPAAFVETNVVGTVRLLEETTSYWQTLAGPARDSFRFHHVSTDEVFGSLGADGAFDEASPYAPRSAYAASKAASDHFVRAWQHTHGLPALVSNCSNNYGPYHFPEKLIPLTILNALEGKPLPVYGRGENVRDWLHVEDHAEALLLIAETGRPGESYAVGGQSERRNIDVVRAICTFLDELRPDPHGPRARLITFVSDRPGHDQRYAIDPAKIARELGWKPRRSFEQGLRETVLWYLSREDWWKPLRERVYRGERLGRGGSGPEESRQASQAAAGRP